MKLTSLPAVATPRLSPRWRRTVADATGSLAPWFRREPASSLAAYLAPCYAAPMVATTAREYLVPISCSRRAPPQDPRKAVAQAFLDLGLPASKGDSQVL